MKNKEIVETYEALSELRHESGIRFPASTAYAIVRNMKILQPIVESIEIARMDIVQQYGEPADGQPDYYVPKAGEYENMIQALNELGEIENQIELHKFPMNVLDNMRISLAHMEALYCMVDG